MNEPLSDYSYKICIIGDSTVGKTCIIVRFNGGDFPSGQITTIGVDFQMKIIQVKGKSVKLKIYDTAGQERFRSLTANFYKGSDGIILVYDITNKNSFKSITKWNQQIQEKIKDNIPKVLVGNKCDLSDRRDVTEEEGRELAQKFNMPFFEVSAKENTKISEPFVTLAAEMLKKSRSSNSIKRTTSSLNKEEVKKKKKFC